MIRGGEILKNILVNGEEGIGFNNEEVIDYF